jgi:hypothetical protein
MLEVNVQAVVETLSACHLVATYGAPCCSFFAMCWLFQEEHVWLQ